MEKKAMDVSPVKTYEKESRLSQKSSLSARDNFKMNSYLPVIHSLIVGINHRLDAYQFLCSRFVFLSNILRMSNEELRKSAAFLRECYPDDLEESFASELVAFAAMMKNKKVKLTILHMALSSNFSELCMKITCWSYSLMLKYCFGFTCACLLQTVLGTIAHCENCL